MSGSVCVAVKDTKCFHSARGVGGTGLKRETCIQPSPAIDRLCSPCVVIELCFCLPREEQGEQ